MADYYEGRLILSQDHTDALAAALQNIEDASVSYSEKPCEQEWADGHVRVTCTMRLEAYDFGDVVTHVADRDVAEARRLAYRAAFVEMARRYIQWAEKHRETELRNYKRAMAIRAEQREGLAKNA